MPKEAIMSEPIYMLDEDIDPDDFAKRDAESAEPRPAEVDAEAILREVK